MPVWIKLLIVLAAYAAGCVLYVKVFGFLSFVGLCAGAGVAFLALLAFAGRKWWK